MAFAFSLHVLIPFSERGNLILLSFKEYRHKGLGGGEMEPGKERFTEQNK